MLPHLAELDGEVAPPQEKVRARNVVCGDDDEARVQNEVRFFGKSVTVVGDAALKEGRA